MKLEDCSRNELIYFIKNRVFKTWTDWNLTYLCIEACYQLKRLILKPDLMRVKRLENETMKDRDMKKSNELNQELNEQMQIKPYECIYTAKETTLKFFGDYNKYKAFIRKHQVEGIMRRAASFSFPVTIVILLAFLVCERTMELGTITPEDVKAFYISVLAICLLFVGLKICSLSGNEDVVWKKSYLACKFFNVEKVLEKSKKANLNSGWRQISILDFPDWLLK